MVKVSVVRVRVKVSCGHIVVLYLCIGICMCLVWFGPLQCSFMIHAHIPHFLDGP